MKNFTLINFIVFIVLLLISLFYIDPLLFFLTIFIGWFISLLCLIAYFGWRGLILGILFFVLPLIIEYFLNSFNLHFFTDSLINNINPKNFDIPININSLFLIFSIPLQFHTAIFFAQKLKLLCNVKKYHKTFLVIISSILVALNYIAFYNNIFDYKTFIKWLIISLITYTVTAILFKFIIKISEVFKELPIIIYITILGTIAYKRLDVSQLIIVGLLLIIYLIILYNEYILRKINHSK